MRRALLPKPRRARGGETTLEILDALPDAVLLLEGRSVLRANAAARRMLANGGEVVGKKLEEILAAGELERFELIDAQRARGWPLPETCRMRFLGADGAVLMADVRWTRMSPARTLLTARDVTDATRAEDLMGRLAQLPSGLDGVDALLDASEPVFRALDWVVAFLEIVEGGSVTRRVIAAPGDPVGEYVRSLLDRVVPRDETPVVAEALGRGEAMFLDNLPSTQVGLVASAIALSDSMERAKVVRSAWCPIRAGDRVTHFLAVTGRDITEHDFVAIQLFAAQVGAALRMAALRNEMVRRERLAAVGEMAAVLAHEVRNPLGIVFNAVGTLERLHAAEGDEHRALIEILRQEANRLKRLVTDLLEFASTSSPQLESTTLSAVVAEAIHAARHDESFSLAEPDVRLDVPDDLVVRTDATLLRRAVLNIVVNAFQHVTPRGKVAIVARRRRHGEIVLSVENDGPRIEAGVARRMFEPFFTTKPTGTGLGLAIVRRICGDIDARIELAKSAPDATGARFELSLPAAPAT